MDGIQLSLKVFREVEVVDMDSQQGEITGEHGPTAAAPVGLTYQSRVRHPRRINTTPYCVRAVRNRGILGDLGTPINIALYGTVMPQ
jgi:hypothetical protein